MSLLLTVASPFGVVMAADERLTYPDGTLPPREGHRKVIPWPAMNAAVGFAGLARLQGACWTDVLLERLMAERWSDLEDFARGIARELPRWIPPSLGDEDRLAALKVQIAGYGPTPDGPPWFWYVRNTEWEQIRAREFRVMEDLRQIRVPWASRWSGRHDAYARRAQSALDREGSRMMSLEEVAEWSRLEVVRVRPEIAAMIREDRERARKVGKLSGPYRPEPPLCVGRTTRAVLIRPTGVEERRDDIEASRSATTGKSAGPRDST